MSELHDRALATWSPSKLESVDSRRRFGDPPSPEIFNAISFIKYEGRPLRAYEDDDEDAEGGTNDEAVFTDIKPNVLILDTGRDGVFIPAICKILLERGAMVAVTVVPVPGAAHRRRNVEAKHHSSILARMMNPPGWNPPGALSVVMGIPYRAKAHTPQPPGERFAEDLVVEALKALDATSIDCLSE